MSRGNVSRGRLRLVMSRRACLAIGRRPDKTGARSTTSTSTRDKGVYRPSERDRGSKHPRDPYLGSLNPWGTSTVWQATIHPSGYMLGGTNACRIWLGTSHNPLVFDFKSQQTRGIFVIHLFQNAFRQAQPVNAPASLGRRGSRSVVKILVLRLQKSVIDFV